MTEETQNIIKFIASFLDLEEKEVQVNSHFFQDLNVEKITLADLYLAIQAKFGLKLPPQGLEKIQTVSDLLKVIEDNSDEIF